MKLIFSYVLGSHFYQFGAFYGQGTDLENIFGVAKFQIFFWVCLIFLIFLGIKSRSLVQAYVFRKIKSNPNGVRHL